MMSSETSRVKVNEGGRLMFFGYGIFDAYYSMLLSDLGMGEDWFDEENW